uniref:Uncharacterized protein n=1 Tax=Haptolina ericina TaxID=156174 RepID=A0A7S3FCB5_9EUKA
MLQRIKFCMAEGITVVLVHCEPLFESLYDLLNQHYTEYGNQLFVRLAFGSASRLCPIARGFRVVVVVEKVDAYTYLAPPLLNRFEKQVIEWRDMVPDAVAGVLPTLRRFVSILCGQDGDAPLDHRRARRIICGFHHETLSSLVTSLWQQQLERRQQRLHRRRGAKGQEAKPLAEGEGGRQQAGQHTAHTQEQPGDEEEAPGERRPRKPEVEAEASQSVAHRSADGPHHSAPQDAVQARPQDQAQDSQLAAADDTEGNTLELLNEAFHRLIWLCTPEAVCRILHGPCAARLEKEFAIDMRAIYFQAQAHSSVPDLVERHLQPWSDEDAAGGGEQLFLLTHSPLTNALLPQLEGLVLDADAADAGPPLRTRSVALHELSSAEDLTALLQEVYEPTLAGDGAPQLLVLSCDLLATSVRRIRHVQHLVGTFHERHRAAVKQQMEEAARTAAAAAAAEEARIAEEMMLEGLAAKELADQRREDASSGAPAADAELEGGPSVHRSTPSYGPLLAKYLHHSCEVEEVEPSSEVELNPVMLYMIRSEKQRTQEVATSTSPVRGTRGSDASTRGSRSTRGTDGSVRRARSSGGLSRLGIKLELDPDQKGDYKAKAIKEVESFLVGRAGVAVRPVSIEGIHAGQRGGVSSPLKEASPQKVVSDKTTNAFRSTRQQQEEAGGMAYAQAQETERSNAPGRKVRFPPIMDDLSA